MSHRAYTPAQDVLIAAKFMEGASLASLRREFGGSYPAVRHALQRQGVYELRPGGKSGPREGRRRKLDEAELSGVLRLWQEGLSATRIGLEMGIDGDVVRREIRKAGLAVVYRPNAPSGERHGHWRGGRTLRDGYVFVNVTADSPFVSMCNGMGYIAEHRLRMAESLGRPLLSSQSVHHVNGDRQDNRLENLQLRQGKHGNGVALQCADCGSHNINAVPLQS